MKKTIGIVSVLVGILLSFPVLADENGSPAGNNPTPSATSNPPEPPQGGGMNNMQPQTIHNDAQNYREADNDANANNSQWKADREKHREEMKAKREKWREEMKARREHRREEMKEHREHQMPGGQGAPQGGTMPGAAGGAAPTAAPTP